MQFKQLKKEIKTVTFESVRAENETYFEAVLVKEQLQELNRQLEALFGPPAWPSKATLSPEVQEVIEGFGGIMKGQTLYFVSEPACRVFAMLWPWQDGQHITLKTGQK
ncbi:MAG TPA: hypothetical protein VMD52_05660 [Patescibacteria group bacterium]|nr:hypothetical protein [Patescibacteria group bacterium]